jgi:predicted ester cyclase
MRNLLLAVLLAAAPATADTLPSPENNDTCAGNPNRDVYLRELDLIRNQQKFEHLPELVAEDYVNHSGPPGSPQGRDAIRSYLTLLLAAFPDRKVENIGMICAGDFVIVRSIVTGTSKGAYFGQPPTGKAYRVTGTDIYLVKEGKLQARWGNEDALGMMRQLGYLGEGK